ncbi:hypothetical protein BpHYR1_011990 [Brachionus plicatilis]|uniref:Uncharacterized protein n=1 Tax=Brachionus plicatilis TaxID=10195 RepID=A0A3M7RZM3_BRAPC|nr:hypothetical protein BpHYR1_011990 [Brachionus plicatilis]
MDEKQQSMSKFSSLMSSLIEAVSSRKRDKKKWSLWQNKDKKEVREMKTCMGYSRDGHFCLSKTNTEI